MPVISKIIVIIIATVTFTGGYINVCKDAPNNKTLIPNGYVDIVVDSISTYKISKSTYEADVAKLKNYLNVVSENDGLSYVLILKDDSTIEVKFIPKTLDDNSDYPESIDIPIIE